MRTRQLVWVALAVCGVVTAQQISTRLLSRQVAVTLREILGGGSLTDVATSMGAFRTNVPPGFLSKPAAAALVFDTMEATISNVTIAAVDSGVGLRFSVTNFYTFDDTSVVSTYNTHLSRSAAASIESITADQAYLSEAKLGSLITERLNASLLGPIGVVTTGVFTASGTTHLGSLEAGDLSVSRIAAPVLRSLPGEVSYYREVGRAAESWTTVSDMTNSWSVVTKPVFDQPNIVTNTLRISTGSYDMIITNLIPVTINYWDTNYADTVVSANASGYTTNVVWLSIYTNQPAGTPVVTNEIQFLRTGSLPNYTFTPTNHVYTNGVPPVVYTNTFANPYLVVDTSEVYTNITTSPVFTYGDLTVVSTNAARRLAPDTGPVGVCTTSYVTRVYEPGVLRTNASGRLYIHEPTAIKPAGSGTKESPFIMSVPENFRWVRENHKPGGRVRARGAYNSVSAGFGTDGGSPTAGMWHNWNLYETPGEYLETVDLTNGVMESLVVYCAQTNSIDMLDTFLWSYNQWPNGEFIDGFVGISGAPNAKFYSRITNTVPSSIVTPVAQLGSNLVTLVQNSDLVASRYAMYNWPNQGYAHLINYDGRGHSLLGVWVGLHPDAASSARGLLGCAATAPTVRNLTVGGNIEGVWPVTDGWQTHQPSFVSVSGGLFGWAGLGVGYPATTTRWPLYPSTVDAEVLAQRYQVMKRAASIMSVVSNCIVFADYSMSIPGERDEATIPHLLYPRAVFGGAFGVAGTPRGPDIYEFGVREHLKFWVATRPYRIHDSAFVGRRWLHSSHYGMEAHINRLFGSLEAAGFADSPQTLIYAYGERPEILRSILMDNTTVFEGDGPHRSSSNATSGKRYTDVISVIDGTEQMRTAPLIIAPSTSHVAVAYAAIPELATGSLARASQLYASELGYYGSLNVRVGQERATDQGGGPRVSLALAGRYSSIVPHYTGSGYTDVDNQYRILENGGYRAVIGKDAVTMSTPNPTDSGVMLSIDGSGPTPYFAAPYMDNYSGDSAITVTSASLTDERYGPSSYRLRTATASHLRWPLGRDSRILSPNLIVRSAEEMKKPYVVEPKNAVGGGDTAHDVSYPYRNYSLDDWTQPGDLDGWYPVPRGAAGLTYSNQAAIVTSVWQPANIINLSNDTCVVYATNTTTTTTYRYGDLSFTNYYAVAATQTSPTTCVFTVQNQVYHRHSESERHVVTTTAVVSTNSYQSYERSLSIDSRLVASGPVTVSGTVYRANANSLDPRVEAFVVDTRGNDYGTFRIQGTNVTPVVVAAQFTCTNNAISFVGPAFPIYFEWWPDQRSGAGALISVVRGGTPILLDQFNACDTLDGDHFVFNAPTPGYVIIRRGRPTDGLTLVDAGVSGVPDATRFRTESNAVFQVSFVLASDGPPRMTPLPDSLWTRTNFHGAAATNGISAIGAAFIDGTNRPYDAVLRADIFNAGGSRLSDREFFESVSVFCNYAAPEYLIPGEPAILNPVRTSLTSGYVEYPIHVRQLVVLQALGNLGASVTLTLLPGEYLYD